MKIHWIWILSVLTVGRIAAQELRLEASAVARAGGDAVENVFQEQTGQFQKGTVGSNGEIHWKCFVGFDLIAVLEDLQRLEHAELVLTLEFNVNPETNPDWRVLMVGTSRERELPNWIFREKYTEKGIQVGVIDGKIQPGETARFRVDDVIRMLDLSPVNRYVWFRIEDAAPDDAKINKVSGFQEDAAAHVLQLRLKEE